MGCNLQTSLVFIDSFFFFYNFEFKNKHNKIVYHYVFTGIKTFYLNDGGEEEKRGSNQGFCQHILPLLWVVIHVVHEVHYLMDNFPLTRSATNHMNIKIIYT